MSIPDAPTPDGFGEPAYVMRLGTGGVVRAVFTPSEATGIDAQPEPDWDTLAAECSLYTPGHNVHFIQVRLALETAPEDVTILDVRGTDITVSLVGEPPQTWRVHDPTALQLAVMERGGPVQAQMYGHGLLRFGAKVFYPCRNLSVWRSCPVSEALETAN